MNPAWERIYATVRRIPKGRVATYGQVARIAGLPRRARLVGYVLAALEDDRGVPWHRVVNASGRISARSEPLFVVQQRALLEAEGIVFRGARIPLARFGWKASASARS